MKTLTLDEICAMSIFEKLAEARVRFLEGGVKKSGVNAHAEFMYFELEDIVPAAMKIFDDLRLTFIVTFPDGRAVGSLFNLDADDTHITVEFPMRSIAEPGKFRMNEVQGLGAEITYMRRYLYMLILDIVEADKIDAGETPEDRKPATEKPAKGRKKPATKEEREEIKEAVVAADAPAEELQIEALRLALAKLLNVDPEQEDFIQEVMIKTEGLTKVTKEQCEKLIEGVTLMLENYTEAE